MLFDSHNAAEMAQRSHAARQQRKLAAQTKPAIPQSGPPEAADSYVTRRLLRVRGQLERLGDMLDHEEDPGCIDKLCSAIARLCEQERRLADRPLPGSRRPAKEIHRRTQSYLPALEPRIIEDQIPTAAGDS